MPFADLDKLLVLFFTIFPTIFPPLPTTAPTVASTTTSVAVVFFPCMALLATPPTTFAPPATPAVTAKLAPPVNPAAAPVIAPCAALPPMAFQLVILPFL